MSSFKTKMWREGEFATSILTRISLSTLTNHRFSFLTFQPWTRTDQPLVLRPQFIQNCITPVFRSFSLQMGDKKTFNFYNYMSQFICFYYICVSIYMYILIYVKIHICQKITEKKLKYKLIWVQENPNIE